MSMNIVIRPAQEADCRAITALIIGLAREERRNSDNEVAVAAMIRACIARSDRLILVAEAETGLAGYIAVHWIPFPMLAGVEGYISDLMVAPDQRGKRIGARLIAAVEERGHAIGWVRLMLTNRVAW